MSLEDLGNLGDFIGGLAVVASLVYLALQIRRNTLVIQANSIDSANQGSAELMELLARDPELLALFHRGTHDFDALSEFERLRFATLMGTLLQRVENLVAQTERGQLPGDAWNGVATRLRGTFALPGTLTWWERGRHAFTVPLQSWVDREVIDGKPAD